MVTSLNYIEAINYERIALAVYRYKNSINFIVKIRYCLFSITHLELVGHRYIFREFRKEYEKWFCGTTTSISPLEFPLLFSTLTL